MALVFFRGPWEVASTQNETQTCAKRGKKAVKQFKSRNTTQLKNQSLPR